MTGQERDNARILFMRGIIVALLVFAAAVLTACGERVASEGGEAPAFTLPSASGSSVSLQDYEGEQPVLLYFHMALG